MAVSTAIMSADNPIARPGPTLDDVWTGARGIDLSGRRVLVVEDEVLVATTIECELSVAGAEVVGPAYTLDEALTYAEAEEIHLAVLDINLLGRKVWPVAAALHQRRIPYVFASANALGEDAVPEPFAGAPRFDKPLPIGAVLRTLAQLAA